MIRSLSSIVAIIIGSCILVATWTVIEDTKDSNVLSNSKYSILPGHAVKKSFGVGQTDRVFSFSISVNSDKTELGVVIFPVGNKPLADTSFTGEFEFNFSPKIVGQYEIVITNLGSESVEANMYISYLALISEKMANSDVQFIRTIGILVPVLGLVFLTGGMLSYGIKKRIDYRGYEERREELPSS